MKSHLRTLTLLLTLLLGTWSWSALAQPKIATVDMKKLFYGYYKYRQADSVLKERAADFEKTFKGMQDDYQKANEEYKKLLDGANDQAVSAEERERRKKLAEAKLIEIRETEQQLRNFRDQSRATLADEQRRKRDALVREIREVIVTKAKASNFQYVFDSSADSMDGTPVMLFNSNDNDLTEEVLTQLNATAPPDLLKPAESKDKPAEPADSKRTRN